MKWTLPSSLLQIFKGPVTKITASFANHIAEGADPSR
jgi:hypothetical protein